MDTWTAVSVCHFSREGAYVIGDYVLRKPMRALRVQVVCKDSATFLPGRDRERANASEHICNNILGLEQLYKAIVFSV